MRNMIQMLVEGSYAFHVNRGEEKQRGEPDSVAYLCQYTYLYLHKQMIHCHTWALEACEFTRHDR